MAHRFLGEPSLPDARRLTKTNIRVFGNSPGKSPLEPSGLPGPVILTSPKP